MNNHRSGRYARQIQYSPIGRQGQDRLAGARVAILGCGALGSVAAELLVRSGIGHVRLIDRDLIEWTNLQRQSLYDESDAEMGRSKADAASVHLGRINSDVTIEPIVADVVPSNINDLLNGHDLVIDGADNFDVRFLLNDWSLATQTPWVHGGCIGTSGQVRLFTGQGAPCFRCVIPEPPPASAVDTCDTAGVLAPATHLIASLQSMAAIQWLSGNRDATNSSVVSVDLWNHRFRSVRLDDRLGNDCVACGQADYQYLRGTAGQRMESAEVMCGRDSVQIRGSGAMDLNRIATRLKTIGEVSQTRFLVRLAIDAEKRLTVFRDGRVLVDGTSSIAEAKSMVAKYLGS